MPHGKIRRGLIALAIILVAGKAIAQSQTEQKKPSPAYSHKGAKSDQPGADSMPLSIKLLNTGKSDAEAAQEAEAVNKTISLTEALVYATIFQFGALLWQGRWIRRSVKVAESALTVLERPYVYVSIEYDESMIDPLEKDLYLTDVDLTFVITNYGRTPARLVKMVRHIDVVDIGEWPHHHIKAEGDRLPEGTVIGGDKSIKRPYDVAKLLPDGAFQGIARKKKGLFLRGKLYYLDVFDEMYETGFCFQYELASKRFVMKGGDDYNYTRCHGKQKPPRRCA